MKVYRIYEPYHESSESGTVDYGIFSSKDKAIEVLKKICKEKRKKNGKRWNFCKRGRLPYLFYLAWDESRCVYIKEYDLDKEILEDIVGYT
ncbi:MAG: hypothetical protein KatS3mg101_1011 [Patescibacteria group bacterium]|nr:MAG: hypothetical protein KatS3mg101_1011 [Patescibacteria group bacterium]